MIGSLRHYASQYLYLVSIATLIFFGLPMLYSPLRWAKVFRWRIPEHTHLTIYFGRCLAGIICVMAIAAFQAARQPAIQPFFFQLILVSFFMMVVIHVFGFIKNIQPLSETIEIVYWLSMFLITLLFLPQ